MSVAKFKSALCGGRMNTPLHVPTTYLIMHRIVTAATWRLFTPTCNFFIKKHATSR